MCCLQTVTKRCALFFHIAVWSVCLMTVTGSAISRDLLGGRFSSTRRQTHFALCGGNLTIQQAWNDDSVRGTGAVLWEAAEALADFLVANKEIVEGKSVLELGSGLGLVSMVAAVMGAQIVYLSDGESSVLDVARKNLSLNRKSWPQLQRVKPVVHRWGDSTHMIGVDGVDVVLGADIIYGATDVARVYPRLLSSVRQLCHASTVILMAHKRRYRRETYFWELAEKQFEIKRLKVSSSAMSHVRADVRLFRLLLLQENRDQQELVIGNKTADHNSMATEGDVSEEWTSSNTISSTDSLIAMDAVSIDDLMNPLGPAPTGPLSEH